MTPSGIFDNMSPKGSKATRDSWTRVLYTSRNQAYQALAEAEGMDPTKTLGWYDLCRKYPGRFVDEASGRRIDRSGRLT